MVQRISTALKLDHGALDAAGVFDRFVEIDSMLHVDPHLLAASRAPEMVAAAATLEDYWSKTIVVVRNVIDYGDRLWRESVKRFTFPENTHVGLGYAQGGTAGSAVGEEKAKRLVGTAQEIIRAGVEDPVIFELVGLLEPGVGPDLISDITIHIVEPHLLDYTARVCRELKIATATFKVRGKSYELPADPATGEHLILLPKDIMRDLPTAFDWSEVDEVCAYNEALRARMNTLIGDNWRQVTHDNAKEKVKRALVENPEVLADLLRQYREKPAEPYDFARDILGETIWLEAARKAAEAHPLKLKTAEPTKPDDVLAIVREICDQFRILVENNGLCRIFWTLDGAVREERMAQLLFFGIADAYCKANNLDLSPESNSGRGPVDFKFSKGYTARVLVEVKWSKNPRLLHGFTTQTVEYGKAERTEHAIFLVIQVSATSKAIDNLQAAHGDAVRAGKVPPEIKIVDGRIKDSASKYEPESE